jgi:predicted metal-dependent hydrolase
MAQGADELGRKYAEDCEISIAFYPAVWRIGDHFDRFAGFKRNAEMAKDAEALIALWDGYSKGTAHMINEARRQNLRVHVELV